MITPFTPPLLYASEVRQCARDSRRSKRELSDFRYKRTLTYRLTGHVHAGLCRIHCGITEPAKVILGLAGMIVVLFLFAPRGLVSIAAAVTLAIVPFTLV
jgi:hypothetical protein